MKPPKRIALCGQTTLHYGEDGGLCCHEITRDEPALPDEFVYVLAPKPRTRKKAKP